MQYTLSVLVENHAGVLSKISGLFSRRGYNIDSLAVGVTNNPDVSRITIVANGDEYVVEQLEKQLNKVIPVIKVKRLREGVCDQEACIIYSELLTDFERIGDHVLNIGEELTKAKVALAD